MQAAQEADVEGFAERAKPIRDTTVAAASKTERMLAATLDAVEDDPSQIYAAAAKVKLLMNAATTFERLHALKRAALGINDDTLVSDEMPALQIVNLTAEAVEATWTVLIEKVSLPTTACSSSSTPAQAPRPVLAVQVVPIATGDRFRLSTDARSRGPPLEADVDRRSRDPPVLPRGGSEIFSYTLP
ncbi:hypothetical protein [Methylobacterium indicum]|uniref:Uncharacterized protein n=1 Tax=Methylobacterium indicum TaxID=1775910 RepID=A0ABR5GQ98_9HYPH|nr:hypothetical protein [Methylobacterium indicum]KMO11158.1 hypothetical protein QR79_30290 [Methylobacterium indicum]KMO11312.1 hypothetical protein QR78_28850 [Methylobacterium indicum]